MIYNNNHCQRPNTPNIIQKPYSGYPECIFDQDDYYECNCDCHNKQRSKDYYNKEHGCDRPNYDCKSHQDYCKPNKNECNRPCNNNHGYNNDCKHSFDNYCDHNRLNDQYQNHEKNYNQPNYNNQSYNDFNSFYRKECNPCKEKENDKDCEEYYKPTCRCRCRCRRCW